MRISSRTPEGTPNHCPLCGKNLVLEPSKPFLDAPCPHCGHLLWFAAENPLTRQRQLVLEVGTLRFGPPTSLAREAIESLADLQRLQELTKRAVTSTSWEEMISVQ
jgi:hypothetical protein